MDRETTRNRLKPGRPVIGPSMLKCDFGNLAAEIERLEDAGAENLHLDVMDGHFVPNLSYGPMVIERMRERTELLFDAHLMIEQPGRWWEEYAKAGCNSITVHVEAESDPVPTLDAIREAGIIAGVAINPPTDVRRLDPLFDHCDLVLVMSVNPGFGGQSFMPEVLSKLEYIKDRCRPNTILSIDGGIGLQTIGTAAAAGAEHFVVGSAIFDQEDYGAAIRDLTDRAADSAGSTSN